MKNRVLIATPYKMCNLGAFGKAKRMLITQKDFPLEYDDKRDRISSAYFDRLKQFDNNNVQKCLKRYSFDENNLEFQLRAENSIRVHWFICELMKEHPAKWNGYRVTGTVNDGGHAYFFFELFYKHSSTNTKVFSGDKADNVMKLIELDQLVQMFVGEKVLITNTEKKIKDEEGICIAVHETSGEPGHFDLELENQNRYGFIPESVGEDLISVHGSMGAFIVGSRKIEIIH